MISQFFILGLGALSIYFLTHSGSRNIFYGSIAGLAGEPFWLWSAISNGQWGIAILALWYSYCFIEGIRNNYKR